MKAEVISIGSELTCGKGLDTNGRWLSLRLSEIGIPVHFHTTVGDDLHENVQVFNDAAHRADLVLVTGGLGPTADDLTRQALADMAEVPLELNEDSLAQIQEMFRTRNRDMPETNKVQAYFPKGATPIRNAYGTAPGVWFKHEGTVFVCMPGVPREMYPIFEEEVLPLLRKHFPISKTIVHRTLRCFGGGESHIESLLGDMTARGRKPEIGITASQATISLRITAAANTPEEAMAMIEPDARAIYQKLGDLVFGEDGETLQSVVAKLLKDKDKTLATAESCTGGLVGHLLTEEAGISQHYLGGFVTYSNECKRKFLGVPENLLLEHGAVSPQVAQAMAQGCRQQLNADLAIGITGIAGPGGGTAEKPVGLVYVALAHETGVEVAKYNWASDRSSTKLRSAKTALNLVRLHLKSL